MAGILAVLAISPWAAPSRRLSLDYLLPLRHALFGSNETAAESPVTVVVIDEQSYRTDEFRDRPQVSWTGHIGQVIKAIDEAGATVIGFDLVYPTTLDQQDLLAGFDREFLLALRQSGRAGRLVLGQVELSSAPIRPYPTQIIAAGGERNLRHLNMLVDPDDVVRRYPAALDLVDGGKITSFAAELVKRAGRPVPDREFLIDFKGGHVRFPVHSFAGLWHCADEGDTAYFKRHFAGRIVIIGEALNVEDRHVTAKRFTMPGLDDGLPPALETGCGDYDKDDYVTAIVERRTLSGVYIHAEAVNTLMRQAPIRELPLPIIAIATFAVVLLISLLFFALSPVMAALSGAVTLALLILGSTFALQQNLLIPIVTLAIAITMPFPATYAFRFVSEDKEKRRVKHAFRHYLAPALVDELAENPTALRLGGERKEVTVFFSDIAGFTNISEALDREPEKLVAIMNRYLDLVTGIIERHGGYVDKFIGDAVMAVWGAPLDDPNAVADAVNAAIDVQGALKKFNDDVVVDEFALAPVATRIGINTGTAIVGNMGSKTRFNYTITGDAVNLAARLEGANKTYGTDIMLGQETARQLRLAQADDDPNRIVLRRLDRLVVKGKLHPVKVYEVLGRARDFDDGDNEALRRFHAGLVCYYRRRFAEARKMFLSLPGQDGAARLYAERCAHYEVSPPPADWNRSFMMTSK